MVCIATSFLYRNFESSIPSLSCRITFLLNPCGMLLRAFFFCFLLIFFPLVPFSQTIHLSCYDEVGEFTDGLAKVKIGVYSGYVDSLGKVIIPLQYISLGDFSEGLAVAYKGGKYGYIDNSNNAIIPLSMTWPMGLAMD